MTDIKNGERQRLVITGVFDGVAGISRGLVAFIPAAAAKVLPVHPANLGGRHVVLTEITKSEDGRSYTARVLG